MANIIVLGGSGFIGKSLIQKLERSNFKNVKVMVNSTSLDVLLVIVIVRSADSP